MDINKILVGNMNFKEGCLKKLTLNFFSIYLQLNIKVTYMKFTCFVSMYKENYRNTKNVFRNGFVILSL